MGRLHSTLSRCIFKCPVKEKKNIMGYWTFKQHLSWSSPPFGCQEKEGNESSNLTFSTVYFPEIEKPNFTQPNNQQHNRTDYSAFQHKVPAAHLLLSPDTFPDTKQKPPKKAQNRNSYKNPMQEEAKQETVDRTLPTNGVKGKSEQTHIKKEPKKFRNLLGKIQRRNKRKEQPPKNWKKKNYPKKWKKKKK